MKLFYHSGYKNFGDVMNPWFWDHFFPNLGSIGGDDLIFSGIGSVLNDRLPVGRQNIVFGSGAGYGDAPSDRNWKFYAVRGPETAKVFGLTDIALGDPAMLLPHIFPVSVDQASEVVFVPHRESASLGGWEGPCKTLGIGYIDPRSNLQDVIRRIASARLVISESLHGCIVADAYRVPWIPVTMFHSHPFKWRDWLGALDLEYTPTLIDQQTVQKFDSPGLKRLWRLQAKLERKGLRKDVIGRLCEVGNALALAAMRSTCLERKQTFDGRVQDLDRVMKEVSPKLSSDEALSRRQRLLLDQVDRFRSEWGIAST